MAKGTKWEYYRWRIAEGSQPEAIGEFDTMMHELGQDGWELVAVDNGFAYFKRERA